MTQKAATKEKKERESADTVAKTVDQIIGWQGVSLRVPEDWSLVGFGGDDKSGSVRLDSGDAENRVRSVELRWAGAKGPQTTSDLEARVGPLLKRAERTSRKAGASAETETKPLEDKRHPDRSASLGFFWKANDASAVGRIWHCNTCGRVVIAQAYCESGNRGRSAAGEILAGIECHSEESAWRIWGLYGLCTQLPADYALAGQQLMNVYLQLQFQRGQSTDQLIVEQWNLANVQLKGMYLDEWFDRKGQGAISMSDIDKAETIANGHPALRVTGRRSGLSYWSGEGAKNLVKLKKPALNYAALLWECPQSNRAYLIQSFSRRRQPELLDEIMRRTRCHESP
ncbi:MAG TPA: hypothetical protein VFW40_01670 [Capsulimonadaceae bacterium]|nr:hypothetical protein [Capsulimonadaceae bacterium]